MLTIKQRNPLVAILIMMGAKVGSYVSSSHKLQMQQSFLNGNKVFFFKVLHMLLYFNPNNNVSLTLTNNLSLILAKS